MNLTPESGLPLTPFIYHALLQHLPFLDPIEWDFLDSTPARLVVDKISDPNFQLWQDEQGNGVFEYGTTISFDQYDSLDLNKFEDSPRKLREIMDTDIYFLVLVYHFLDESGEPYKVLGLYNVYDVVKALEAEAVENAKELFLQLGIQPIKTSRAQEDSSD